MALANPFGDDAVDFDVHAFLNAAHNNAVAHLRDERSVRGDISEISPRDIAEISPSHTCATSGR